MFWRVCATGVLALATVSVVAAETPSIDTAKVHAASEKGINFLKTTQASDGSWSTPEQPGISGLVVYGLLSAGLPPEEESVAKGLKFLESFVQPDGGIYRTETRHKNYETSIIVLALEAANQEGRYDDTLKNAVDFLKGIQWDASEDTPESDPRYGGQGYGRGNRPDLSNTSFFVEALHDAGVSQDDEAFKKAVVFVSRCQNLEGEVNNTPFASKINDGGFYYTPAAGGSSVAGKTDDGGLLSYGSMTYAGLKSMIYAGVSKDDPRVQAASEWIRKHYTLEENPGLGERGLYYYLHTFAKTMDALQEEDFKDAAGTAHPWRAELAQRVLALQQSNGSWVNATDRFNEGDPNLVTAYCLIVLKYCEPQTSGK